MSARPGADVPYPKATEARKPDTPGRARYKPSNHCAGNVGCPPLNLYARVRFLFPFCTRDRGCSAHPAFPAPSDFKARNVLSKPRADRAARMQTPVHQRHCEEHLRRSNPFFLDAVKWIASLALAMTAARIRRVGKGALAPCPPCHQSIGGGHAPLCPPYAICASVPHPLAQRNAPTSPPHAVFAVFNPSRASTVSRIMNFWIFPVTVIGNSSTNST